MPAKRPRVLQTFNREPVEIVVQAHDAVAGLRGNDYFPGPRGSGLHHLGEDYVVQVRRYLCRACRFRGSCAEPPARSGRISFHPGHSCWRSGSQCCSGPFHTFHMGV